MRAILIGYGSIGQRHATALNRRFSSLVIVDSRPAAREAAQETYPNSVVLKTTEELWRQSWDFGQALIIIATWGPSHYAIFNEAADHGVRHIICEKPLSTSVAAGRKILERARQDGIILRVNHTQRFLGVPVGLQTLAHRYSLDLPRSIVVHGGASGLVTNGIHFIDLANALFGATPTSVLSTAFGEAINPRSPALMFYQGTAIWSFEAGREAVLSLTNSSSIYPTMTIYYKHGLMHLYHHRHVVVMRRPIEGMAQNMSLTRTGQATELLYSGEVPGVLNTFEDAFLRLYDEVVSGRKTTFTPEAALVALEACIGALISGETGRRVDLPIDPGSENGRRVWAIS